MRQAVDVETTTRDVQQQTHSTYRVHGHDQTTTTWSFSSACVSPEGGRARNAAQRNATNETSAGVALAQQVCATRGAVQVELHGTAGRGRQLQGPRRKGAARRDEGWLGRVRFFTASQNGAANAEVAWGIPVRCLLSERLSVGFAGPAGERGRRWKCAAGGGAATVEGWNFQTETGEWEDGCS